LNEERECFEGKRCAWSRARVVSSGSQIYRAVKDGFVLVYIEKGAKNVN